LNYPLNVEIFSEKDTADLAEEFASELKGGEVIILNGDLGSGKTFFIKHTAEYLGIKNVNSPTFAIINEYESGRKIYHFDFYRIKNFTELFNIGYNDYLNDPEAIIFIEWGNLFPELLPLKRMEINISVKSESGREFIFKKYE
jgi:tRNA threonylcarbamoyladenosine biosynthesis protein TsaE